MNKLKFILLIIIMSCSASFSDAEAEDVIWITARTWESDLRGLYEEAVLFAAMEKTKPEYGEFRIERTDINMQRDRALREINTGIRINVYVAVSQNEWEELAIPVRIPVIKGLLGYKLLLIRKNEQEKFSKVTSIEDLKSMKAGSGMQWSITKALMEAGFYVVSGSDYEGLFKMLVHDRFDYFPRGMNEIFIEYENRKHRMPELAIEKSLAIYIPSPTYFFVSPRYPRIAERIEHGLRMMIADGSFDELFMKYNGDSIRKAELDKRRILRMKNPILPPATPLDDAGLWYDPVIQ